VWVGCGDVAAWTRAGAGFDPGWACWVWPETATGEDGLCTCGGAQVDKLLPV